MGKFQKIKGNSSNPRFFSFLHSANFPSQLFFATDVGHYSNMLVTLGQKIYRIFKLNIILYPDPFQDKGFSLEWLHYISRYVYTIYIHYTAYFLDYER